MNPLPVRFALAAVRVALAALPLLAALAPARAPAAPARARPAAAAPPAAPATAATPAPPVELAAAAPPPAAPDPAPLAASAPPSAGWRATLSAGLDRFEGQKGLAAGVALEHDLVPLAPRATLGLVVDLGVGHFSDTKETGVAGIATVKATATTDVFRLVPAFRATLELAPRLTIHADTGLGLTWATGSAKATTTTAAGSSSVKSSSSGLGSILRFAAGGGYDVTPRLRLGADLLGLGFLYGEARGRSLTVVATAGYRL